MLRASRSIGWSLAAALLAVALHSLAAQSYKVIGQYKLPGVSANNIAVDAEGRHLLIASSDGIVILNADTGARLGMIPLKGATDVLVVPNLNDKPQSPAKAFAAGSGKVVSFSLADMKMLNTSSLPTAGASSLCFDEDARTIEAVSADGSLVTIDAASDKVLRSTQVVTGAGQIACGSLAHVYVADTAADVVHVLDHKTGTNDGDIPTCHSPSGLALDTKGRRLFVSCEDGTIAIVDTDSGFTFIRLKGSTGPARSTFAWTPQGTAQWKAAAFVAQQDGSLTAVRMNAYINYSIGGEYKLSPGLRGIVYDKRTHHFFLTAIRSGVPVVVIAGY